MIKDYFVLAFKSLRQRGLRSWLTIIGIFIGIAAVVSLISLGQGLQTAVSGQFGSLSVDILTIQNKGTGFGPPGSTVVEKLNSHDVEIIESVSGVGTTIPRILRVGNLEYNGVSGFGFVVDLPEDKEKRNFVYDRFDIKTQEGIILENGDKGKILLGNNFIDNEDFGKDFSVGRKIKINEKEFKIGGILESSKTLQLNSAIFMLTSDLEDIFGIKDEYDLIVARVEDKNQVENVASDIEEKLRRDRNEKESEETFTVETPLQSLASVNTILGIINFIVIGVAAISLLVGGIGIANTMYTSVVERTREIGVMKAIGARNREVLILFLIESGMLGIVGGILGAFAGFLGAYGISTLANNALGTDLFQVNISYPLIFGAVSFSFLAGILSGLIPAGVASKLKVVDALRK